MCSGSSVPKTSTPKISIVCSRRRRGWRPACSMVCAGGLIYATTAPTACRPCAPSPPSCTAPPLLRRVPRSFRPPPCLMTPGWCLPCTLTRFMLVLAWRRCCWMPSSWMRLPPIFPPWRRSATTPILWRIRTCPCRPTSVIFWPALMILVCWTLRCSRPRGLWWRKTIGCCRSCAWICRRPASC